jgi:hypothetical protein
VLRGATAVWADPPVGRSNAAVTAPAAASAAVADASGRARACLIGAISQSSFNSFVGGSRRATRARKRRKQPLTEALHAGGRYPCQARPPASFRATAPFRPGRAWSPRPPRAPDRRPGRP